MRVGGRLEGGALVGEGKKNGLYDQLGVLVDSDSEAICNRLIFAYRARMVVYPFPVVLCTTM